MQKEFRNLVQAVLILLVLSLPTSASAPKKDLTFEQVYQKEEPTLLTSLPQVVKWLDDHRILQYGQDSQNEKFVFTQLNIKTGREKPYPVYRNLKNLPDDLKIIPGTEMSSDGKHCLFEKDGDILLYSLPDQTLERLTRTPGIENNPTFSPDGKKIAFTRDHNLYVMQIESRKATALTDDGSERIYNGKAAWVYYEEIIGRRSNYRAFWWSPDSEKIVFLRFDETAVPLFTLVRGTGTHGEVEITPYPKPGDPNPRVRLGVVEIGNGKPVWMNTDPRTDHYIAWPFWTADGEKLLFQTLNRDQNHLRIYAANPRTGENALIYQETQSSWVDFFTNLHFLENRKGFILRSDRSGWSHLYHCSLSGEQPQALTRGDWKIRDLLMIDPKQDVLYFTGFQKDSTENHLFRMQMDGTGLERLTREPGYHRISISPGARFFIDTHSSISHPPVRYACSIDGRRIRKLADSRTEAFDQYALGKVELFRIPSTDGYRLPARWILPPDLDRQHRYPVLFQIYGGPQAPTVHNSFPALSGFYLASKGIIVISVDHRGSGHFGKEGASMMHRKLGKWEIHDYSQAVKWLRNQSFVDPQRIAISGGSYGGYVTCMALTRGAEYFTHGFASAAVTDWRLYDSIYTERYMDTPRDNPDGYQSGSVLTHAQNLTGKLFIIHGEMDDNVHPINSIQLISKLQDLHKDFYFMLYPGGRHGWGGAKRIHSNRLQVQFWFEHLLDRTLDPKRD